MLSVEKLELLDACSGGISRMVKPSRFKRFVNWLFCCDSSVSLHDLHRSGMHNIHDYHWMCITLPDMMNSTHDLSILWEVYKGDRGYFDFTVAERTIDKNIQDGVDTYSTSLMMTGLLRRLVRHRHRQYLFIDGVSERDDFEIDYSK